MACMRDGFISGALLDGRFRTISPLNHGSFGLVFKAFDTWTGDHVALKCITKSSASGHYNQDLAVDDRSEELAIHRRIGSHDNIVNLLHHFETEHHIYLVLEFCPNGDLYEAIRLERGPGQTEHVRECMLQLVSAVEHMHSLGLYHRDIKPENIFLSSNGEIKLGDFGLATMDTWSFESAVGSDRYMAPEQFDPQNIGYSPAKADVWALGICLLNILFSKNPFAQPSPSDRLFADFANDRQTLFDVFPSMSQDTFEVLMHSLAIDPNKRSLAAVKNALKRVVAFTTDDESLDEFCAEESVAKVTTTAREPLRTPSLSSAQFDENGAFMWAKNLPMSPPVRQLSAIPDEYSEDLFPSSEERSSHDWFSMKPDNESVVSFVDSGLGVSLKSTNLKSDAANAGRSKPMALSGSLPATLARPIPSLSAIFGSATWCPRAGVIFGTRRKNSAALPLRMMLRTMFTPVGGIGLRKRLHVTLLAPVSPR
jgi:serine/threonine protein kinase